MYYLPTSCLFFFFLFSLSHLLSCVSRQQELRLCETLFQCGNITAGFPFSGENRPLACGYPSLKLHCYKNKTSIIILNHLYDVLDIDQTSNTLRLSRAELLGSFCNATFTATTLPPEIFELSPSYKHLTVFYLCDPKLPYRSSYTCPGTGPVSVSETLDYHNTCDASFRVYVPKSFVPEEKELNITNLESALSEGFEVKVKVKIDEKACQKCSSFHGICGFEDTTQVCCKEISLSGCNIHYLPPNDDLQGVNQDYYGGDSLTDYVPPNATNGRRKFRVVAGSVVGGFMFLFLVLAIFLQIFPKRNRNESDDLSQQNLKDLNPQQDSKTLIPQQNLKALNAQQDLKALIPLKQYSYATVKRITKSFAEVVGQGGFGTVYRGTLCDGRSVAVKILKNSKGTNGEDFINEVASMSLTSHVNIVTLLGFCSEGSKRAILYEFLENGSLDKFISSKRSSNMDWMALYRIALGVARGLEYLHHGCRTRIVHFDIKPHNVLLDDNLCPKVSDFGLAKLCKKKESILSLLDTRGTIGYIAPEVFSRMYGRVSHKSDVYSYGMLVLEMIGARNKERADQNSASNASSMYFPEWIYKDLEKRDNERLNGNGITCEEEVMEKKMTLVGLWCIQPSPSDRPSMNRVVEMMEGSVDVLEVPPRPVLKTLPAPLQDSSTLSEDISVYTEVCSINGA